MVKIKVFKSASGYREFDKSFTPIADYVYCVYLFGFIVHSVTLRDITNDSAKTIFAGIKIKE